MADSTEEFADATLRRMVRLVDPEWALREATPVESGFSATYRLVVEAGTAIRTRFLKASPDGRDRGIPAEARITRLLEERTSIPVPSLLGVVDEHADLPAPFALLARMPGDDVPYEEVGWFPDTVLRTLARQVGAHLGELHRLDAVESFGYVDRDPGRTLAGGRPDGRVSAVSVRDGRDSWRAALRARVDQELARHETTRFADLTPQLDSWCRERIESRPDHPDPVLGRNDHGLHNLLADTDTGDVTALLDWAYTLAVPPAYDFKFAAYLYSGAFLAALPAVSDRRDLVRRAMRSGYRSTAPGLAETAASPTPLYELLAMVHIMNDFDQLRPKLPAGTADVVADGLRAQVGTVLDGQGL